MSGRLTAPQRRRTILHAARDLFAKSGSGGMTTSAVAKAVGVTEPILYRHFPSKRALRHDLLEETSARMLRALRDLASEARHPLDALRRMCRGYPNLARRYRSEFLVINRALAEVEDSKTKRLLREHYEAYQDLVADVIRAGQKEGLLRRDIPARIGAWHLIHTALGYLFTRPLEAQVRRDPAYEASLAEAAVDGLLPKGKT